MRKLGTIHLTLGVQALLLVVMLCAAFSSCSKQGAVPSATARVMTAAQVQAQLGFSYCGDTNYAEVNSAWLKPFYDDFRHEIFQQGVVKWDERFDCNHFAGYYVALAQTRFYLANFQSRTPAQTLALGQYWYQSPRGGHAIVAAFTERGLLFIEPQTGAEVTLTPEQKNSAWLKLF